MPDTSALIRNAGAVPAVQFSRVEDAVPTCMALLAGGLTCVEVTFRTPAAAAAIAAIRGALPEMLVGAGTILATGDALAALAAGASFLVSPGLNPGVVTHARARGAFFIPGVATPTEIESALGMGLSLLKFFPAQVAGGVQFLKAVHGPYPDARFIPSGGIAADNLEEYLALPNVLACSGSWMTPTAAIAAGDFPAIERLAGEAAAAIREIRSAFAQPGLLQ